MSIFYLLILALGVYLGPKYYTFHKSDYKSSSGNSFFKIVFDKGLYGEFLTYVVLEKFSSSAYIFTNIYLPKENGTTEIDLVMLHNSGIYVFESKNYSGWIFGDEKNRHWTQTFQNKQKN